MYHFSVFIRFTTIAKYICNGYNDLYDLTFIAKKVNVFVFQYQYEKALRMSYNLHVSRLEYIDVMIPSSMK